MWKMITIEHLAVTVFKRKHFKTFLYFFFFSSYSYFSKDPFTTLILNDISPSPAFSLCSCNSTFVHAYFTAVTAEPWRNCSEICNAPRVFVSPEREPPPINYAPFSFRKPCHRLHFSNEDENRREQLNSWAKRYAPRIMIMERNVE